MVTPKKRLAANPNKPKALPAEADNWAKSGGIDPELSEQAIGGTIPTEIAPMAAADEAPKRGRQKGKRSNPDYTQVGAYIPKELDKAVKRKLIDEDIDFSELVANLLSKWLIG